MSYVKLFVVCLFSITAMGAHCGQPTCIPDQTKCLDNKVMLCAPNSAWVEVVNCNEVQDMDNLELRFTCTQEENQEAFCQKNP